MSRYSPFTLIQVVCSRDTPLLTVSQDILFSLGDSFSSYSGAHYNETTIETIISHLAPVHLFIVALTIQVFFQCVYFDLFFFLSDLKFSVEVKPIGL